MLELHDGASRMEQTYIVAPRREARHLQSPDWVEQLRTLRGVRIEGASAARAQIKATAEGVRQIRQTLGASFYVEDVVTHERF